MRGDVLLDFAGRSDLFQILVILRITHHRQEIIAVALHFVFFDYTEWNVQKLNLGCCLGFYPVCIYPQSGIIVCN